MNRSRRLEPSTDSAEGSDNITAAGDNRGRTLLGYEAIGGAKLSLDRTHPLSKALPVVMKVEIPADATGEVGFKNVSEWLHFNIPFRS